MRKYYCSPLLLVVVVLVLIIFPVMAAYKAHHNDGDTGNFLQAYPAAKDTKLDNCYLCHTGGKSKDKYLDTCDYCHATYGYKAPHPEGSIQKTLNPFGAAYLAAGRSAAAFASIAELDSDRDGFSNEQEINRGYLPGDVSDNPTVKQAAAVIYTKERLMHLPKTSQFMAVDTAKAGDYYATYTGVQVWELLKDAGILASATDITVYSADGYSRNYAITDIRQSFPQGRFLSRYPWIKYPETSTYLDGQQIKGELKYLLAYERDGYPLLEGRARMGKDGGKVFINGEGPYRFIAPSTIPVVPDRSEWSIDRDDPPYPYNPERPILKNADYCGKTVVAIQVNTANQKLFQYDWNGKAWQMVEKGELVVYGAIQPHL
ncbi:hypothetical protein SOV_31830 [Sporomusa ovata DSM 2662]|uniref:Uncharacterized protein n=1 Tax=Sporomusa ovata TaxID=2378 RepID=A0A0U1L3K6_9FIRM|nr:GEGP motif-containing diheme protein [Sporomusa ovata]EQB25137.1 hypothetical protein SOV_5c02870 [Sporomusa ovata DSM 2662]CQR73693.1 hypothetical protein SpAn4DRAFT_0155 [Sporomusa ovata]